MESLSVLVITIFLFLLLFSYNAATKKHRNIRKLPPGPWKLPLIGNLHQMVGKGKGKLPHHILTDLAKKYGPLMQLQFGEIRVVVVSSPRVAKEIMKTHDLAFASRPESEASKILFYDRQDIAFHPYDEYWKQMRKILVMELLSAKKVKSFAPIRLDEGDVLVESIRNSVGEMLNLSDKIKFYTNSVVWKAAFGMKCNDQETFIQLLNEVTLITGGIEIADIFPSFKFLHFLSKKMPKLRKIHSKIDDLVEEVINEHLHNSRPRSASSKNSGFNGEVVEEEDFIHTLLRIKETTTANINLPITTKNIKALILDVFTAGNGTTSTTTIWAMTEMIRNPQVLAKAQKEIRQAFKGKECIVEEDYQGVEYLNSIIKETLRLHPPTPLNLPRESMKDCVIDGYHIPFKTRVLVNSWAIGRDSHYWHDPDTFLPDRFLNSCNNVDFMGNYFEFIPFGSGRRICPGISFALPNIQLPLSLLLYHFDWNLPKGMKPEDMDLTEAFGTVCSPINHLYLIPTLHTTII